MLKAIAEDLAWGKVRKKERPMTAHIPYTRHITDTVIGLDTGALCTTIRMNGLFFQTEDQAELNMRNTVQNTLIRGLSSSRYSIWSTVIRREVSPEIGGEFSDSFCEQLNTRYMDQLNQKRLFVNELYFTLVQSGMKGALGIGDNVVGLMAKLGGKEAVNERMTDSVRELTEKATNIAREFEKYGAKILGIRRCRNGQPYSEPAEYFHKILSLGIPRKMRLPRMGLNQYVGSDRLHFSKRVLQTQGATAADDRFGAMLSIKEYPPFTGPGMLDGLLQVNHEFVLTQSFTLADKPIAQERISRLQRQINASDEAGTSVEHDIDFALNSLVNQEAVFGLHHFSLMPITQQMGLLDKAIADLGGTLSEMNVNWLREDMNVEPSYWAQLPGNQSYIARSAMLSSSNFAGFSSMHNFAYGQNTGNHWGLPVSVLETTSQTPYNFNFHRRDIGHFLVTGPTGSGKTVAMTFLLAQAFRVRPEPKAVFFDKDRGAEIFIRAVGGQYSILDPGASSGFNPLQIENTPTNREFLLKLLKAMLRKSDNDSFTQREEDTLARAIERLMKEDIILRNLTSLSGLLKGSEKATDNDLSSRLRPWIEGDKAWLFNAERDALSLSDKRIFGFDMTSILDDPDVRTPALMYLYHRLDELLTGEPVMMFMDEAWKLLQDPTFARYIEDKLKTIRKLNGIVGLGTQSGADIVKSPQSHTLIEQTATNIHFPNPRADVESYQERLGLTAKEFEFIKNTPPERRLFLIKHGNESVIARLDLGSMPDLVKVLSGTKSTVEELSLLRAEHGDNPKDWLPYFCGWEYE